MAETIAYVISKTKSVLSNFDKIWHKVRSDDGNSNMEANLQQFFIGSGEMEKDWSFITGLIM